MKPQRSLKARALQYLAQREQSRVELRRKLLPHARAEAAAAQLAAAESASAGTPADGAASAEPARESAAARVEAVLDWLTSHDYLSQERFVESRVHARAARFGNLRIRQELKQHAVELAPSSAQTLKDSEFGRACAVRARKFSAPPAGAAEQARQMRFLMGRGFSSDVIYSVLREAVSADSATPDAASEAAPEAAPDSD